MIGSGEKGDAWLDAKKISIDEIRESATECASKSIYCNGSALDATKDGHKSVHLQTDRPHE